MIKLYKIYHHVSKDLFSYLLKNVSKIHINIATGSNFGWPGYVVIASRGIVMSLKGVVYIIFYYF